MGEFQGQFCTRVWGWGRDSEVGDKGNGGTRNGTNLILETLETCPPAHHERVVGREDGDGVDALCLELVVLFEVGREVVRVASRLYGTTPIERY